jgi:hypothetical protein
MRRFMPKALILGLFLCALPCVGLAAEFFSIPDDLPGPPMYLQLAPRFIGPDSTPEWIAIPVYREISGIPLDFNLLDEFDAATAERRAYAQSVSLQIQGFVIRDAPPPSAPLVQEYEDRAEAPTPVLFVHGDEWDEETADGVIYIDELLACDSLQFGLADFYTETVHTVHHVIEASGVVAWGAKAGASFRVHYAHGAHAQFAELHVTFE